MKLNVCYAIGTGKHTDFVPSAIVSDKLLGRMLQNDDITFICIVGELETIIIKGINHPNISRLGNKSIRVNME